MTDLLDYAVELSSKPSCHVPLRIVAPDGAHTRLCHAEQHDPSCGHTTYFRRNQLLLPAGDTTIHVHLHPEGPTR